MKCSTSRSIFIENFVISNLMLLCLCRFLIIIIIVNGWHVYCFQEGYAYVVSEWSRIYFMTFYLIIMVSM